ncbi:non-ribosomal peptide synthetase [Micromonospora ureilytica]|uniref:Amino acid adenylation domain-containing protein/thioester reductase-like protein n=1 Tax=Micromonospora ureilytica TaxID=709868 RepID=A0ABS0JSK2_9ACTN|nr:amino acid adenylation domain-containing protein [Micromonospora ureilytica]MBG6069637.1 amino acid adenylation domain-containing protein/thioester reductase-like protein [Micromonospora ureilytica]
MSDSLREQLLSGWSGRAVAYPADRTVLQLFQECAAARPDRVAVVYGHDSLTYGELDQRSNTLAHELHERGVRRGEFLPLALESGLELPLAMIASMKIAAPFVPIDPAGPVERTTLMIETMGARVLVDAPGSSTGPESVTRISLDATRTPGTPAAPAVPPATLDDPIYGFYTSGSTGEPKCAVNIHRGLLNRFSYMTRALSSRSDEVVLQNSRPQFDSSLWQLLWPLTTGSMVVMPTRSGILDLPSTIDTIERYGVTMTDFVPSIFNTLVELLHAEPELVGRLRSLRRLLIGGEEMTAATVHAFRAMLPTVDTINTYGPTEASIGSVFHHVTEADGEVIPLGRPIDNTYLLILDSGLTLVRPGEIGELYIGGDCLGLGYLNDPERTKAAFVDNPFPEIPGNRLYRTGDLGFHSANGLVHFAGRRDNQVKIAGVRIELLDVEAAFLRLDDVTDAKVVASSDLDNRMLIAFVTTRATGTDASVLMAQVRDMLPATMLPRRIVILDQMPLTPNGKADRRALVALADSLTSQTVMAVPTDAADVVRAHWLELLPVAQLDPDDDFFESGGDSLTAQRLAIALEQRFNRPVSARDIFELPTLRAQIALLTEDERPRTMSATSDDVRRATVLPPDIPTVVAAEPAPLADVFLTGATGFVGAQLLYDLLDQTSATAYCLVRASDERSAHDRIVDNLLHYRLWRPELSGRIRAVPGDLGRPGLGLGLGVFDELAATIDTILHCGAMINLRRDYRAHAATNVSGTLDIIRLATANRTKSVHFISTLGVIDSGPSELGDPLEGAATGNPPTDGYGQSKWAAERLLDEAAARGLPVTVHRVGEVMPHSWHGVPSRRGLADLIVKACVNLRAWFRSPIVMDYTQVECISSAVIAAAVTGRVGYFHPVQYGLVSLDDLLAGFVEEYQLVELPYEQFRQRLVRAAEQPDQGDLARLLALLPAPDNDTDVAVKDGLSSLFSDAAAGRTGRRAAQLVRSEGLTWQPVGPDVFNRYVAYYRSAAGLAALKS